MVLSDADRQWLLDLNLELWPKKDQRSKGEVLRDTIFPEARTAPEPKVPREMLTHEELERVLSLVRGCKLLTSMFSSSMFGGYGMSVFDHEPFPGTGPTFLLALSEEHLPPPTRLERAAGGTTRPSKKTPGCGRDEAWKLFSPFTHSAQNREWLKSYKMDPPRERGYYDY